MARSLWRAADEPPELVDRRTLESGGRKLTLDKALLCYLKGIAADPTPGWGICYAVANARYHADYQWMLEEKFDVKLGHDVIRPPFGGLELISRMQVLWAYWPEFSGNLKYPVPAPSSAWNPPVAFRDTPPEERLFDRTVNMWADEYGEARMRLVLWMIDQLEGGK